MGTPHRWLLLACGLLGSGCAAAEPVVERPRPAASFGDGALATRIETIERRIAQAGGTAADRMGPMFLAPAARMAQAALSLDAGSCWLLLGLGGARIDDLDLLAHDSTGRRVDADLERDAHPRIVVCPEQSRWLAVTLVAVRGAGEAYLGVFRFGAGAPPDLSSLDFEDVRPVVERSGEPVEETLERMDRTMSAEGFRRATEPEMLDLDAREPVVRSARVDAGRCLGAALVAADADVESEESHPVDLDLQIFVGSRQVAEDRDTTRDAHVAWCSDRAVDVRIKASSYNGEGRGWMALYDATEDERVFVTPTTLPDEPVSETRGPTFERAALDVEQALRDAGYERLGTPFEGMLGVGEAATHPVHLSRGDCYAFRGLTRPNGIRDLDLFLDDPSGARAAEDRAQDNEPTISFCPSRSGDYALGAQAYDGGGGYTVLAFRMASGVQEIPGIGGRIGSTFSRMAAELRPKGFAAVGLPQQMPAQNGTQRVHEASLHYGSCYVVAAIAATDESDIDIEVRDYRGRSVSVDTGMDADARVFVCPDRTAPYSATVTVATGDGPYMFVVFESKAE